MLKHLLLFVLGISRLCAQVPPVPNAYDARQTRTITGRVVSTALPGVPEVFIRTPDGVLLGQTAQHGRFQITISRDRLQLELTGLLLETQRLQLAADCDTMEVVMLEAGTYDFMSGSKVDRQRLWQFRQLPTLHALAVDKQLFLRRMPCYTSNFIPIKAELDELEKQSTLVRAQIRKTFESLAPGDTITIPFSAGLGWRADGTDRTTLAYYSAYTGTKQFECVVTGIVVRKAKYHGSYRLTYRVFDCSRCSYLAPIVNGQAVVPDAVLEYDMKYLKLLTH